MDVETLALAKAYTKATANGLGAVKGAPCTIAGTEEVGNGVAITFQWTGNDGATKQQVVTIPKGQQGSDGASPTITAEETDEGTILTITNPDGGTTTTTIKGSNNTYTDKTGAGITLGGFTKGEKVSNLSLQEALYKLLHPYVAPSISFTMTPADTLYEAGKSVDAIQLKITATKSSKDLVNIIVYYDNTSVKTFNDLGSASSYTKYYDYSKSITGKNGDTHTFKVTTSDGTSTVQSTKTITFIGMTYYGIVDATVGEPTANQVTGLSKTLKNAKGYSYTGITTNYGKVVYAYPKSLGTLSSIKDPVNNYNYTTSFTRTEITINDIDYLVYTQNEASAASNVTINFA